MISLLKSLQIIMSTVNIVSLGGVQETGKNLYVVEVDNDIFILDIIREDMKHDDPRLQSIISG